MRNADPTTTRSCSTLARFGPAAAASLLGLAVAAGVTGCGSGHQLAPADKTARALAPAEKTARALAPGEKTAHPPVPMQAKTAGAGRPSRALLDAGGRAIIIEPANVVRLSTNAGQSWSDVHLPAPPAAGQSIAASPTTISALTVDSHGMALQRSTDGGQSWQARPVPLSIPTDQADLAISPDGQQVAVLARVQGSANDGDTPQLLVGPAGGTLVPRQAPASGGIGWAGRQLLLAGGPLSSRLYASTDSGASWVSRPVGGVVAPRFNVDPNTPSIATPLATSTGGVLLPVTIRSGQSASVQFYRSSDGSTFVPAEKVALSSRLGPGALAVASTAGPGAYLVAEPGNTRLHLVTGSGQQTIAAAGLPGPVDSLSFADAEHGLAQVTTRSCSGSKQNCTVTVSVLSTSDGGHSWVDTASHG